MSNNAKTIVIVLVILVVAVLGYMAMNAPDDRSTGERIGDAVENLDQGLPEAADQLEDQSAGERMMNDAGEALEETGNNIQQGAEDAAQGIENAVEGEPEQQ